MAEAQTQLIHVSNYTHGGTEYPGIENLTLEEGLGEILCAPEEGKGVVKIEKAYGEGPPVVLTISSHSLEAAQNLARAAQGNVTVKGKVFGGGSTVKTCTIENVLYAGKIRSTMGRNQKAMHSVTGYAALKSDGSSPVSWA